jgi:hypothetical protein
VYVGQFDPRVVQQQADRLAARVAGPADDSYFYFFCHNLHVISGLRRCLRRVTFFWLEPKESNQRKIQVWGVKLLASLVKQYAPNNFTEPLRG